MTEPGTGFFLVVRICFKSMRLNKFIHEGGTDSTHSVDEFVPKINDCLSAMYGTLNARNSYNAVEGGLSYFKQILSKSYLVSFIMGIDIHWYPYLAWISWCSPVRFKHSVSILFVCSYLEMSIGNDIRLRRWIEPFSRICGDDIAIGGWCGRYLIFIWVPIQFRSLAVKNAWSIQFAVRTVVTGWPLDFAQSRERRFQPVCVVGVV